MEEVKKDLTKEEAYWREHHAAQPYANKNLPYEHYAPAYRTGYEGALKYTGKKFEDIEDELVLDYEKSAPSAPLPWDHARHAVHAAWTKLSNEITPLDPSRGVRTGF